MANNYLLTAATVAGVAAGSIGTAALTARAGVPETKMATVQAYYTPAQVSNATGAQMAANGCALLEATYTGAPCDLTQISDFRIALNRTKPGLPDDPLTEEIDESTPDTPGQVLITYHIPVDGTFTPGAPE